MAAAVQHRFVKFAQADSLTELINLKLLLDRARISYRVVNENLCNYITGPMGRPLFGAVEILVPENLIEQAKQSIEELFIIHADNIPEICPACETKVTPGKLECEGCGLFLC